MEDSNLTLQLRGPLVFYEEIYDYATMRWVAVDVKEEKIVKKLAARNIWYLLT